LSDPGLFCREPESGDTCGAILADRPDPLSAYHNGQKKPGTIAQFLQKPIKTLSKDSTCMDVIDFAAFLLLAATVTLISYGFDRFFAQVLPFRTLYFGIRIPGIILHELAHAVGCIITGAKIKKIILISKEGGSVTYEEPKIPLLGTVIINTAPLLLLPLFLVLLTWAFQTVIGGPATLSLPPPEGNPAFSVIVENVFSLFYNNLILTFNLWFLAYIFFCVSIVLSLAPSPHDLKNAAAGIALITITCLLIIVSGYAPAIDLLARILALVAYAFTIGLVFEMIVAVVSLPFLLIYGIRRRG
jgi:hypothetical protein